MDELDRALGRLRAVLRRRLGQPVNLAQACELYEKARRAANDLGTGVVMSCKLAMAQALHGQPAEARKVLAEIDAGKKEILGTDRQRGGLARQVADAVLPLKEQGPADGQKALRAFLDQFRLNPNYTDRGRRETLELQLFAAELLLASDLEADDAPAASRDLKYLDPLLETFKGRGDMRPFLRRYYDWRSVGATGATWCKWPITCWNPGWSDRRNNSGRGG